MRVSAYNFFRLTALKALRRGADMTFQRAFLISLTLHASLLLLVLLMSGSVVLEFDITRGLSSLSVHTANQGQNRKALQRRDASLPGLLRIIVTPEESWRIAASPDREKRNRGGDRDVSRAQRRLLGAISSRAALNARNSAPEYPYMARQLGYEGKVIISIEVLPNGRAGRVAVERSSGYRVLDLAAVRAARAWVFFEAGEYALKGPITIRQKLVFLLRKGIE